MDHSDEKRKYAHHNPYDEDVVDEVPGERTCNLYMVRIKENNR